jgi:hypothetical protein
VVSGDLTPKSFQYVGWAEIERVKQEGVLADDFDIVGMDGLGREIAKILSHQYLSAAASCGGQDMAVLGIVDHLIDERLIADDKCVREGAVHLIEAMPDLLLIESTPTEIPLQFGHYHRGPERAVHTSFRDAEQGVT